MIIIMAMMMMKIIVMMINCNDYNEHDEHDFLGVIIMIIDDSLIFKMIKHNIYRFEFRFFDSWIIIQQGMNLNSLTTLLAHIYVHVND